MPSDPQQPDAPPGSAPCSGSARSIEPKMTWEEIKANHRDDIKRQAIMFYKSKNFFDGEPRKKRWTLCVQMIVETWLMLGPQKDHVPTQTIYL